MACKRALGDGQDPVRLANLVLARLLAENMRVLPSDLRAASDKVDLQRALAEISAFEPPGVSSMKAFTGIVEVAERMIPDRIGPDFFYAWSARCQASDPKRKGRGAYSTPPQLASQVADRLIDQFEAGGIPSVIDPSVGHGALLLAVASRLQESGRSVAEVARSLYGVEIDPAARELCCLFIWLFGSAQAGVQLAEIQHNIRLGNPVRFVWRSGLTEGSLDLDFGQPTSQIWEEEFPEVFSEGGFDSVVMNPPWESLRSIGHAELADERDATRERLSIAQDTGRGLPKLYSCQGRGDRNLYKIFTELAPHLLNDSGTIVALLPGAFASDYGMHHLRSLYLDHLEVTQWTGFENLERYFPIDGRYKFGVLVATKGRSSSKALKVRFMARHADACSDLESHVSLGRKDLTLVGGSARMMPEVQHQFELEILKRANAEGRGFFDPTGSLGTVKYVRDLDLTLDAQELITLEDASASGYCPSPTGAWTSKGHPDLYPVIEGRMVGSYDFFQKSWRSGRGRRARWTPNDGLAIEACQPQYLAIAPPDQLGQIAICDVTSATNTRTMIASWAPSWRSGNTAPLLNVDSEANALALLSVLNSMTFDWILRRIAAGLHLNRFYLEATPLPTLPEAAVSELAGYSAARILDGERTSALAAPVIGRLKALANEGRVVSPSRVEVIVARGYGLSVSAVSEMFSATREDRKGMWRYFQTSPQALDIATRSIEELAAA